MKETSIVLGTNGCRVPICHLRAAPLAGLSAGWWVEFLGRTANAWVRSRVRTWLKAKLSNPLPLQNCEHTYCATHPLWEAAFFACSVLGGVGNVAWFKAPWAEVLVTLCHWQRMMKHASSLVNKGTGWGLLSHLTTSEFIRNRLTCGHFIPELHWRNNIFLFNINVFKTTVAGFAWFLVKQWLLKLCQCKHGHK